MGIRKAIVVVSFGSTVEAARKNINNVENYIAAAYPDRELFSAYSSSHVINKIRQEGGIISSLNEILDELVARGYQDIFVQPTHIIAGAEYNKLLKAVEEWQHKIEVIQVGKPLISDVNDMIVIGNQLKNIHNLEEGEALLLFGHGSRIKENDIYTKYRNMFEEMKNNSIFVATIEGNPALDDAIRLMKAQNISKVFIAPLLLCEGRHVKNDMLGNSDTSWLNRLADASFTVRYTSQGLSAHKPILQNYLKGATPQRRNVKWEK